MLNTINGMMVIYLIRSEHDRRRRTARCSTTKRIYTFGVAVADRMVAGSGRKNQHLGKGEYLKCSVVAVGRKQ